MRQAGLHKTAIKAALRKSVSGSVTLCAKIASMFARPCFGHTNAAQGNGDTGSASAPYVLIHHSAAAWWFWHLSASKPAMNLSRTIPGRLKIEARICRQFYDRCDGRRQSSFRRVAARFVGNALRHPAWEPGLLSITERACWATGDTEQGV